MAGEGLLRVDDTKSSPGTAPSIPQFAIKMLPTVEHLPYLGEQTVIFP